jgi:uncharacterized protein (TIGR02594 family)
LRIGASGDAVRQIQLALKALGYSLTGTAWFGPATDTAVETFQRRAGLVVDGEVGPKTAAALDLAVAGKAPVAAAPAQEIGRPLWLEVSLAHLALKEGAGSADNKELVADIKTVAPDYQHDATPWCAGWVSFCLVKAEQRSSSEPLWALSYSDTKNQPVVKLAGPALGAIAVKKRAGGGHVTFVAGRTRGGALACCGGNQNDEVNVSPYDPGVFVGFFWPKGSALPGAVGLSSLPIVAANGRAISEA